MNKQTYEKYLKRLNNLILEYEQIDTRYKKESPMGYYYDAINSDLFYGWLAKVKNIIIILFRETNFRYQEIINIMEGKHTDGSYYKFRQIYGLLKASLEDLENGYITSYEYLIANEIFDNLLEEAEDFIFNKHNKDIGAILLRIILEDNIKRLAKNEKISINRNTKTSTLNDELKKKQVFNQTQWRQNQAWLDIGNAAAHGNFSEYTEDQVKEFLSGLKNFLANELN